MHRDIKPQNIAIDKTKRRLRLLDWELADFYQPRQKYNSHVETRVFKPPELLINYPYYDYSMDIWSTGIMFSIMMLRKFVLDCGDDDAQ
jgi:casein kinase II subunit alpha